MGTELQRAGLEPGGSGDTWNLSNPDGVRAIQRRYVEAGSELILTNTFGTNRFVLERYDLADRAAEIAAAGARLAREAAGRDVFVLGDVGPCGGFLEPLGDIAPADLRDSLASIVEALLSGGVDGIIIETMTALDEALIAVEAALACGAPVVVASMAFDTVKTGGFKTMMGVGPEEAARALAAAGAHLVGANCGTGVTPRDFLDLAAALREGTARPLVLQPNAGQPVLVGTTIHYPGSLDGFAEDLVALAGVAAIVGGCCGSTPDHIAAFARRLGRTIP
jgi:5-methyltetrahydrofolate--homocysteine methyltransferase